MRKGNMKFDSRASRVIVKENILLNFPWANIFARSRQIPGIWWFFESKWDFIEWRKQCGNT